MSSAISFPRLWSQEDPPSFCWQCSFQCYPRYSWPLWQGHIAGLHPPCPPGLPGAFFAKSSLSMSWCMGLVLPRYRTLLFPLLNFIRFMSDYFFKPLRSSKSNGVSTTPTLGTSVNLLRVQFPAVVQVSNEEVEQPWPLKWLLGCISVDWPPAGLHAADHNSVRLRFS